jgi:hypothetical protein
MRSGRIDRLTYLVLILGAALHVYLAASHAVELTLNSMITPFLSMLPYVMCLVLLSCSNKSLMALCAGLLLLTADLILFRNFIFDSRGAGYNLISMYTPVWKLVLLVPLGCFIGRMIDSYVTSRGNKS